MQAYNQGKSVQVWVEPKPSLIFAGGGKQIAKEVFPINREEICWQLHALCFCSVCVCVLMFIWNVSKNSTNHHSSDLQSQRWREKCAGVCFGVREVKHMFACGRWPALLPVQKPRDIIASCVDAALTHQHTQTFWEVVCVSKAKQTAECSSFNCQKEIHMIETPELKRGTSSCTFDYKITENESDVFACKMPQAIWGDVEAVCKDPDKDAK